MYSISRTSNFVSHRKQCVRLNSTESTWLAPRSGIPQWTCTVLGPMLFLIYINDLPTQLESSCAIFADDTTVHAASSDSKLSCARISADLDVAAELADSWGMLFSTEESEHLHIGKATGQRVTMRGVPIPQVKHHRHLGLAWMNNKLTWTEHIKDVHGTCSRMIGVLRRLRRRLQGTTVKAIFIGAIRPRMEYASQVWSGGPTQSLQRLQDSRDECEEWDFKAQTKGRRERKRKGKKEEGKGGKGYWKWSFGRNGKNRKRPSRESNPGPQQTRLMLYHWVGGSEKERTTPYIEPPRQATSPASLFKILSVLPFMPMLWSGGRTDKISNKLAGDVACLGGSMVEHQPHLLGSQVRFPAGAFAIFSVSAKASLPISLSSFPFLFLSLPLPFLSSSSPFWKEKGERDIGSEALAETEKIANAPAGNRTRDPANAADALPLNHGDKRHHQLVCSKFYPFCHLCLCCEVEAERIKFRTN